MRPIGKRGQIDFPILTFAIILIGLIVLAPIVLKVVRSTITPFSASLSNMSVAGSSGPPLMLIMFWVYS